MAAMDDTHLPPLFAALVDDAGLFPPERLPMAAALARHRADAVAGHGVLTHRFLCPASRLDELRAELGATEALRLGLIVDTGLGAVAEAVADVSADARLRLETVEVALAAAPDPAAAPDLAAVAERVAPELAALDARVFAELPVAGGWRGALATLAAHGVGAKVRCGGVRAELFPSGQQLAAFVVTAAGHEVPCKATAGLHHAVRHRDPATGFDHHGFLNLLLAACRAVEGGDVAEVRATLALEDAGTLAAQARSVPAATAAHDRRLLVAYGSCSTSEPIDDLVALRLIPEDLR